MYRLGFADSILLGFRGSSAKSWECRQISRTLPNCEKTAEFWTERARPNLPYTAELQGEPRTSDSTWDRLAPGEVIHWFLAGNFSFACCISWHFVDFIHPYFGLIFAGILNPNFVLCWLGSLYAAAGKFMFFLSMPHTICADMLIIRCTLFPKAVFLSSVKFFGTLLIFNEASKTLYIELFPLVGLLLGFAARGGVLVLMSRDRPANPYICRAP